jgi:hypothetical protein
MYFMCNHREMVATACINDTRLSNDHLIILLPRQARYGLDTRMFSYDPRTAQRAADAAPQLVPYGTPRQRQPSSRCSIM